MLHSPLSHTEVQSVPASIYGYDGSRCRGSEAIGNKRLLNPAGRTAVSLRYITISRPCTLQVRQWNECVIGMQGVHASAHFGLSFISYLAWLPPNVSISTHHVHVMYAYYFYKSLVHFIAQPNNIMAQSRSKNRWRAQQYSGGIFTGPMS